MSIEICIWRFTLLLAILKQYHYMPSNFIQYLDISLKLRTHFEHEEHGSVFQDKSLFKIAFSRHNKVYWITLPFFRKTWGLPKKDNNGTVWVL